MTPDTTNGESKKAMAPIVGSIFLFNLIIGAGCLAIPKSFAEAGIVASSLLLLFLMIMGYTTVTFMIEAMALSNYLLKTDDDGSAIDDDDDDVERSPQSARTSGPRAAKQLSHRAHSGSGILGGSTTKFSKVRGDDPDDPDAPHGHEPDYELQR